MAYKCIKDVNTDFGDFKVNDIVSDELGKRYMQFEKVADVEIPVKGNIELLVETPSVVEVVKEKKQRNAVPESAVKETIVEETIEVQDEIEIEA